MSNDCHKINSGNQSNFHGNMKDNEIKTFLTKISNLFFQGISDKTIKNNQSKEYPLSR